MKLIHELIRAKPVDASDFLPKGRPAKLQVQDFRKASDVVADVRAKLQGKAR